MSEYYDIVEEYYERILFAMVEEQLIKEGYDPIVWRAIVTGLTIQALLQEITRMSNTDNTTSGTEWYLSHDNIATLARWMFDQDMDCENIVDMVEKPWHFTDEWEECEAEGEDSDIETDEETEEE